MYERRKVRIGMIGGGPGAGIAPAHRFAMRLDNRYELVAGVFSRSREKSRQAAHELAIPDDRVYGSAQEMAAAEAEREDGIDIVSIVTPQDSHYEQALPFLTRGINVICDKPLTSRLDHAQELEKVAQEQGLIFALTHNYSGYAMVRHAARLVRNGELGDIRIVQVEHASGWGARLVESTGRKQAVWRTDPAIAGSASVVFDLGTHAHHLMRFITGLEVQELSAEMSTIVPERRVFDNAHVKLRLSNGARGTLWATMAATGQEHGLRIRVFGEKASLEWRHEDPHHLTLQYLGGRKEILAQGQEGLSDDANNVRRVGLGHPEGFLEAFANIYTDVADAILARGHDTPGTPRDISFPTARDGVLGIEFVEAVCQSHSNSSAWTRAHLTV
jgi:predicted dehydrogenase